MVRWSHAAPVLDLTLDLIARAHPTPVADDATALALLSDAELRPGLAAAVAARPMPAEGLWVFGYGSLIWRPEFAYSERRVGTVHGYHRRFCLLQRRFRGSVEKPGLVLALDVGGACEGVAFRLTGAEAAETYSRSGAARCAATAISGAGCRWRRRPARSRPSRSW